MFRVIISFFQFTAKIILGTILSAALLAILLSLNTGEPVMGILFSSSSSTASLVTETFEHILGKLPFLDYIFDAGSYHNLFYAAKGFSVFHDFIKALMLFISTGFFFDLLSSYIAKWKSFENRSVPLTSCFQLVSNIYLASIFALVSTVLTLLLHEWLMSFWIRLFGNSSFSNWLLLALILLCFASIYLVIPVLRRKPFTQSLVKFLIDAGLVLCCILHIHSLLFIQNNSINVLYDYSSIYIPLLLSLLFSIIGFCMLLHFKVKKKGS